MSWTRRIRTCLVGLLALALALLAAPAAQAHEERPVTFPDGSGKVPAYRDAEPDLIVCKTDRADCERNLIHDNNADYYRSYSVSRSESWTHCLALRASRTVLDALVARVLRGVSVRARASWARSVAERRVP